MVLIAATIILQGGITLHSFHKEIQCRFGQCFYPQQIERLENIRDDNKRKHYWKYLYRTDMMFVNNKIIKEIEDIGQQCNIPLK